MPHCTVDGLEIVLILDIAWNGDDNCSIADPWIALSLDKSRTMSKY
jgi:hypothetical protein